jgi:hypothetical protein
LLRLCACLFLGHERTQGDIVTGLVESSIAQYAVIQVRRTEGPSERFVIAYSNEESLRELIARPSIIACGFSSREEAQTNIDTDSCTAAACKQTLSGPTIDGIKKYQRGVLSAKRRLGARLNLMQTGRTVGGFLQAVAAGAILIFYSRNVVSTVIRSFIGA